MSNNHKQQAGFTILEMLISIGILSMIGALIWGAVSVTLWSQKEINRVQERYHAGRVAMARLQHDLACAFLSKHRAVLEETTKTVFLGKHDQVTFTYLGHERLDPQAKESDQGVVSFYVKKIDRVNCLVRREKNWIDDEPERGGQEEILAEGVKEFELEYWDSDSQDWTDEWKAEPQEGEPVAVTTEQRKILRVAKTLTGQEEEFKLPTRVKIRLVLEDDRGDEYPFVTQVEIRMKDAFQW